MFYLSSCSNIAGEIFVTAKTTAVMFHMTAVANNWQLVFNYTDINSYLQPLQPYNS